MILKSVGRGGVNNLDDVKWVQERLNNCNARIKVEVDGVFGSTTAAAIDYFQGRFLGLRPDGIINPSDGTAIKLSQTPTGCWTPKDMLRLPMHGTAASMSQTDFVRAARTLNISLATIKAIASVESRGKGFDSSNRPVILYEPHLFSRLTNRKYDEAFPFLSSRVWNKALYNKGGTPYEKLEVASALDRSAALQACSWGAFQILGMNFKMCGFSHVDAMVEAMFMDEGEHLLAFVRFVQSKKLGQFLRNKDWAAFANGYNGPLYKQNKYDEKIEKAYKSFSQ